MIDWTNGWVIAAAVGGLVLLLGVGTLVFQAGCALADVTGPRFLKALLVFGLALAVCVPLGGFLVWLGGVYDKSSALLGPVRSAALGAALVGVWALSALIYAFALATPYRKGLVIAGTELAMAALLAGIVAAVVMVILAVVQIARQPPPRPAASIAPPILARTF
jgi:hypothetical protein